MVCNDQEAASFLRGEEGIRITLMHGYNEENSGNPLHPCSFRGSEVSRVYIYIRAIKQKLGQGATGRSFTRSGSILGFNDRGEFDNLSISQIIFDFHR